MMKNGLRSQIFIAFKSFDKNCKNVQFFQKKFRNALLRNILNWQIEFEIKISSFL